MTKLIEASGLVKVLGSGAGQVRALNGVNLTLEGNELVLLMGPSGSGKTTLLCVLGCMLSPTQGTVSVLGQSTRGLPPERLTDIRVTILDLFSSPIACFQRSTPSTTFCLRWTYAASMAQLRSAR